MINRSPVTIARTVAHGTSIFDLDIRDQAWKVDGLCAQTDPDAFFPEKGGSTREAKATCARCEVRVQCLQEALDSEDRFGIWGGFSQQERRKIKAGKPVPGYTPPALPEMAS